MTVILASVAARGILCSSPIAPTIGAAIVYNGVDMVLCGLTSKYFLERVANNRKEENNGMSYIFYSRCIGCLGGIIATHLLCKKPINPLVAIIINAAACVACFFMLLQQNKEEFLV